MFLAYMKRFGLFIWHSISALLRILIIGGGIGVFLIFHYTWFTDSSYGIENFYRLTTFLLGTPVAIVTFLETFLWLGRREKRKQTIFKETKKPA